MIPSVRYIILGHFSLQKRLEIGMHLMYYPASVNKKILRLYCKTVEKLLDMSEL